MQFPAAGLSAVDLSTGEDDGRRYVSVNQAGFGDKINFTIASHIFGDPQFQGPPGATLAFDCKGGFDTIGLTLSLSEGEWMPGGINYTAKVAQPEVIGGWKTVIVPLSEFFSEKGLTQGVGAKRIGYKSQESPPNLSRRSLAVSAGSCHEQLSFQTRGAAEIHGVPDLIAER
jgi:hypothetical protein